MYFKYGEISNLYPQSLKPFGHFASNSKNPYACIEGQGTTSIIEDHLQLSVHICSDYLLCRLFLSLSHSITSSKKSKAHDQVVLSFHNCRCNKLTKCTVIRFQTFSEQMIFYL